MAIIKLGPTVIGIRGTVGGMTFTANKSGPYARAWSRGANPRAPLQAAQRGRLASIPELWRALTPAQQGAWDTFAALPAQDQVNRLGETFSLSGFGFFTKCNTRLLTIGRSTISATPVLPRPSAPVISSLQLPYLPNQYAKITYPSGEFPAGTDQIIEISQAISTGRQVSPTASKTLKETQSPPASDSGFLTPYLDRFGPGAASLKGFTRVHRQTTEGLRSSAGTAAFVSTDSPGLAAAATAYDGINDYALRGAGLTGIADSQKFTFATFIRINSGSAAGAFILANTAQRFIVSLDGGFRPDIFARNSVGTTVVNLNSDIAIPADDSWHSSIFSIDLTVPSAQIAIDGVLSSLTVATLTAGETMDLTVADWSFGARIDAAIKIDGCLSMVWFNHLVALDLADPAIVRLFTDSTNSPVDLGQDGAFPTDAQPILFVPNGNAATNKGSGGNFVNQAASAACATTP